MIPTPIDDTSPLEGVAKSLCEKAFEGNDIICVEELKEGRRRWIRFGLPKDAIEDFVLYNEHTRDIECENLIGLLKRGKNVLLMSDCGLPAFCDPGVELVNRCHENQIKVTSTPFSNSISLAVALSGFDHSRFIFEGFLSPKSDIRSKELKRILNEKSVSILMDTPYRMKKLISELSEINPYREGFLAMELNQPEEKLLRGTLKYLNDSIEKEKKEFILVLNSLIQK